MILGLNDRFSTRGLEKRPQQNLEQRDSAGSESEFRFRRTKPDLQPGGGVNTVEVSPVLNL